MTTPDGAARIHWIQHGTEHSAQWRSESGWPAPKKVVLADDTMNADTAWRLALDGTAIVLRFPSVAVYTDEAGVADQLRRALL